jgi:hypothetical protein
MACSFTIRGYGSGFATEETRFTGSQHDACSIADEFAESCGEQLYAVVVTDLDSDDVIYVTHSDDRRKEP